MSGLMAIELGAHPWAPTADTVSIEVLNYYDAPLTGIIERAGVRYLFHCIVGQTSPRSVWVYSALSDQDMSALAGLEGSELDEWITSVIDGRDVTLALALPNRGVRHAHRLVGDRSLPTMLDAFLTQLEADIEDDRKAKAELLIAQ